MLMAFLLSSFCHLFVIFLSFFISFFLNVSCFIGFRNFRLVDVVGTYPFFLVAPLSLIMLV